MSLKFNFSLLAIVFCFYPAVANAEFGFGPCCAGATCGIVPCDSTCAGPALETFGNSFSSKLESIGSEHQSLTNQFSDVTVTATDLYANLGQQTGKNSQRTLMALDGLVSKLDMSMMQTLKAVQTQYEVVVNAFVRGLKASSKIEAFAENAEMFDEQSLSRTFESLANRSDVALKVVGDFRGNVVNLNSLLLSSIDVHQDIKKNNLRASTRIEEIQSELPLASILSGIKTTDLSSSQFAGKVWPYIGILEKNRAVRQFSLLVAGSVEAESGQSYNEQFVSPSINGVSSVETVTEVFLLNNYGLNRQLAVNNQLSNALLSQLAELRRERNNLMARTDDNAH